MFQQEGMEYIQSTIDSNLNQSQNEEDFKGQQDKSQDVNLLIIIIVLIFLLKV